MIADTNIHTRALLVWLQISAWSARKYDRALSNKVNRDAGASADASRTNKFLLPGDAASYKALMTLMGAMRAWHYDQTLAWSDEGWRCLPTANYIAYTDGFRERSAEIDRAVDAFVADYPDLRYQAASKLNGLYKPEDYPDVSDIRSKFRVGIDYMPVPAQGDIRVNLASDQVASIEARIASQAQSSMTAAMNDAWQRLHTVVAAASNKLADPTGIFRDSLIENVRECCTVLQRLNITNDPNLERMRVDVFATLANEDPQLLRDNKRARQTTAEKAKDILDAMSAFYSAA